MLDRRGITWPLAAAAFVLGSANGWAQAAGGVVLTPHRAVYDIALDRAANGSGVSDVSGRMVYELTGSPCEGYTQTMRFVTRMQGGEGSTQLNDLRSSSFEDKNGSHFRFNSNSYKDEQLSETTQGDAVREGDAVKVELARPNKKSVTLKPGVYFPVQHSVALLEAARAGKTIFIGDLYDGSEKGEKVYSTTSAIGRRLAPGQTKNAAVLKNGNVLDRQVSWPVSISYFEPGSENKDAVPVYELAFQFYESGVSSKLRIDYGEFAIRGELKDLTLLETTSCDSRAAPAKPAPGKR